MKNPVVRFIVALAAAVALAAPAAPQAARAATGPLCYVDMDATGGTNNGNSWTNAYLSLQSALTDTNCTEIWVAEGLYKPGAAQTDTFQISSGVAVYGGFAGTETARTQRNWNTNITVLSGDIDNNDTIDADGVVQNYTDVTGSNSYHVTYMDGITTVVTSTTVLDGFVVTAGKANGLSTYQDKGGGLFCIGSLTGHQCSPTLANITFVGNYADYAGGAIYNFGYTAGASSPSITDAKFLYNHAEEYGGAIYNNGNTGGVSSPTFLRVTFDHNSAVYAGGAMENDGYYGTSSPSLTDVTFDHNSAASGAGGGIYNHATEGNSSPTLLRVTFSSNSALYSAGAMYSNGNSHGNSNPSLTDVSFYDNSANYGAAMYNYGYGGLSSPSLKRVTFDQNHAAGSGGAIFNSGTYAGISSPTLSNVTFSANSASQNGGAMYSEGTGGTSGPTLTNVTFNDNSASQTGGAIYNNASSPTLTNVVLWGDQAVGSGDEIYNGVAAGAFINHSVVQGSGGSGGSWDTTLGTDGGNNLDADPKLALLTDNGGFTKTMSLIWGSSAINAGDNAACAAAPVSNLDQRGVTRPVMDACDIGALERIPPGIHPDFDSDGLAEMGYFRAASGLWALLESSENYSYASPRYFSWGQTGDVLALGDYDGDGRMDPTVRRPPAGGQSAAYRMLLSTTGYDFGSALTVPAGWPGIGDTPVPGDYNGDGFSDPAIWRGSAGVWIIPLSPTFSSHAFYSWGQNGDKPIAADVDCDGQTDIGYWRPSTGVWGFLLSTEGYSYGSAWFIGWGSALDKPVMADYDGDHYADPAVLIPPAGGQSQAYRILLSSMSYNPALSVTVPAGWPGLGDTPVPGDYDGDIKADAAIWRANAGVWIIPKSSTNNTSYMFAAWGAAGDVPAR